MKRAFFIYFEVMNSGLLNKEMSMKNINKFSLLTLLLPLVLMMNACNNECKSGSGIQTTENRNIGEFSKVELGGNFKLIITQNSSSAMKITADDNVINEIKTRISGDVLEIKLGDKFCDIGDITIELSSKQWQGIDASGSTDIVSENQINTENFELNLSGSSTVDLNLVAGLIQTNSSGNSVINLKGQARKHDADLSGATELNAFDFVVSDYIIESSGSSNCTINVLNNLEVKTSGSSKILYRGNPKNISNDKSGTSVLEQVE